MTKFTKGMYMDSAEVDQPMGTYRYAKNIIDGNVAGAKENEDGFLNAGLLAPYDVIGIIPVDTGFTVFSTNDSNCEIGYVERNGTTLNYTSLYNDPALNFRRTDPVKGEYRIDIEGDRSVTWIDGRNTPRIINIDNPNVNNVQDLNVFRDVNNPAMSASSINDQGGSLRVGAYTIITKYQNQDGSETNWFVHDHVFYINDDSKSLAFNENDGAEGTVISNKSINLTFINSDTRYDSLVVGYIRSSSNVVSAVRAVKLTNASTVSATITGTETSIDLTLDEVLTGNTSYTTARAITQVSGQLFLGNLSAERIPELQQVACGVNINYTHDLINVVTNVGNHKDNLPPTFMPGEVYAFYLGVEMNSGGWAFYHIPGRHPIAFDLVPISSGGLNYIRFQVDDTNDLQGSGAGTNMGFWRNENEFYPNDPAFTAIGKDLRGMRIQHHRFPTVNDLVGRHYAGNTSVGITHLPRLGINVSNVVIPPDIQAKLKRWKIVYAKKTDANSLVTGSDLLQFPASTDSDSNIRWSTSGNWILEAQGSGFQGFPTLQKDSMRIHSLDYLYDKSTPPPAYARFHYKLRRQGLNPQWTGFRTAGATMTISGENRGQSSTAVIDYTVPGQTTRSAFAAKKKLNNFTYLPQSSQNGKFKSLYTEGCFVADIESPGSSFDSITPIRLLTNSSTTPADAATFRAQNGTVDPNVGEDTMYTQFYRILTNVHTSVFEQDIVPVESYDASPGDQSVTWAVGGDTFLCYMSFLTISPLNSNPDATLGAPTLQGVRIWRGYIGYSKRNFNYRHQTTGSIGTYYYGKTDPRTLFNKFVDTFADEYQSLISSTDPINIVEYNSDFNSLNDYLVGVIWSLDLNQATEFPNTIIWSPVQNEESKEYSWRTFPAGNRYVTPKNKGPIINLQGVDNKDLLIHCTRSLFKTRTDIRLDADQENVFFKSAQLFEIPPEEVLSTANGYAGTQNKFACVLSKVGYVFVDNDQGKIFIYNDKLNEISTQGMRNFFRDYMKMEINYDNPFNLNGYTAVYDERNNRIIIGMKDADRTWTASFNPQTQTWVSFHDYIPDYMFTTADNTVLSIRNNIFYLHLAEGTIKGKYYTNDPYSSYIDIVYRGDNDRNKVFISTWWNTEVYPATVDINNPSRNLLYDKTCTHLTVRTYDQATERIPLIRQSNYDNFYESNMRVINRTWVYDNFRDISIDTGVSLGFYDDFNVDQTKLNTQMDWWEQRKFMDKFLICRYEFFSGADNLRWLFLDSDCTFRYEET